MAKKSNIASGKALRPAGGYSVMARRRHGKAESLDYFPTPPFATRALCEFLELDLNIPLGGRSVWEPACGEMHMARPLAQFFGHVRASDCFAYRPDIEILDFPLLGALEPHCDFIITNPPFKLAEEFIFTALKVARIGVAMLVRSAFIEGQARYHSLYSRDHPHFVLQFTERVCMLEGRLIRAGDIDPFSEAENIASSATAYCWLVWIKASAGGDCRLRWIPPCRHRLELPGDYPEYEIEQLPPPANGLFGESISA